MRDIVVWGAKRVGAVDYAPQLWLAAAITVVTLALVALLRWRARWRARKLAPTAVPGASATAATPSTRGGLLIGADGRVSTSKFTAALWTVVVLFVVLGIALIFGAQPTEFATVMAKFDPLYFVELGGPFAAAILAKSIVGTASDAGTLNKSIGTASPGDIFTDDAGNTDLVDTQYVIFNLLVVGIVLVQFCQDPGNGAPPINAFLAILTGGSATTYVANKAVVTGKNPPTIDRVVPPAAPVGATVQILGSNLLAQGDTGSPAVFFNGFAASGVSSSTASSVTCTIPNGLPSATSAVTVTVRAPSGAEGSKDGVFSVVPAVP